MIDWILRMIIRTGDLDNSQLFGDNSFYNQFIKDIRNSDQSIYIESPFLTMRRIKMLAPHLVVAYNRGVRILIITRGIHEYDSYTYIEANNCISFLRLLGAEVRTTSKLYHRKLAICDDKILWEGSLNILSQNHSLEIMRRTDSCKIVRQMKHFIKLHK